MYRDGSIIVKGRKADAMRFKVCGDVVYPGPIEQKMSQHPNVLEISVSLIGYLTATQLGHSDAFISLHFLRECTYIIGYFSAWLVIMEY